MEKNILNKFKEILSKKNTQLAITATIFAIVGFIIGREYEKEKKQEE